MLEDRRLATRTVDRLATLGAMSVAPEPFRIRVWPNNLSLDAEHSKLSRRALRKIARAIAGENETVTKLFDSGKALR